MGRSCAYARGRQNFADAGSIVFRDGRILEDAPRHAIGVAVGAASTWAVAAFAGWRVALTPSSILLAAGFPAAVGVFFGFYPARRAAALLPIQALRYE